MFWTDVSERATTAGEQKAYHDLWHVGAPRLPGTFTLEVVLKRPKVGPREL